MDNAKNLKLRDMNTMSFWEKVNEKYSEVAKKVKSEEDEIECYENLSKPNVNEVIEKSTYTTYSLFIFNINNIFRRTLINIVNSDLFTFSLSMIVIINCFCLVLITFPSFSRINDILEIVFICIYSLEALLKIISYGFYFGRNSYLRNPWNVFDFIIVITGIIGSMYSLGHTFFAFRMMMLLRPLKSITYLDQLRGLINSLINSLLDLTSVFLLMLFFIIFFSAFSLTLWSREFDKKCRITILPEKGNLLQNNVFESLLCGGRNDCGGNIQFCQSKVNYFRNGYFFFDPRVNLDDNESNADLNFGITNFKDFFRAFFTIFQASTLEGWYDIMYLMMSAGSEISSVIFFFSLVFIVSLFIINLTIAVLLYNFEKYRTNAEIDEYNEKLVEYNTKKKTIKMTDTIKYSLLKKKRFSQSQSRLIEEDYFLKRIKPYHTMISRSILYKIEEFKISGSFTQDYKKSMCFKRLELKSEYQKKYKIAEIFYTIYCQPIFQYFIHICILTNCILLGIENYLSLELRIVYEKINVGIVVSFTIEIILILVGKGIIPFIKSLGNIWDFFIVCGSVIESFLFYNDVLNEDENDIKYKIYSICKILRILRIFKLIRWWKSIQIIFIGLISALKKMVNYLVLLALFFYIYSLIGYDIFHNKLRFNQLTNKFDHQSESNFLNFDDFPNSILTVFSVFIGYGWGDLYYSCYRAIAVDRVKTFFFFFTLILLGNITMKNIFLAYLIQHYQITTNQLQKNENRKKFVDKILRFFGNKHLVENQKALLKAENLLYYNGITVITEGQLILTEKKALNNSKSDKYISKRVFNEKNFDFDLKFKELSSQKDIEMLFYDYEESESSNYQESSIVFSMKRPIKSVFTKNVHSEDDYNKSINSLSRKNPKVAVNYIQENERRKGLFIFNPKIVGNLKKNTNFAKLLKYFSRSSLCIFYKDWKIRILIKKLINSKWFNNLILGLILLYTLSCVFDNPWNDPEGIEYLIVFYSDFVFTFIFFMEAMLKIIANGLFFYEDKYKKLDNDKDSIDEVSEFDKFLQKHRDSAIDNNFDVRKNIMKKVKIIEEIGQEEFEKNLPYLRKTDNIVDFLVLLLSLGGIMSSIYLNKSSYTNILGIRVLRSLRPIRILTRSDTLKLVIKCVVKSIPALFHISIVIGVFLYVYAVIGMNIFANDSYYCSRMTIRNKDECIQLNEKWINYPDDFSNFFTALRTLFILLTTEGWTDIFKMQLSFTPRWYTYLYFLSFIILGYMFILNLLVTILIDNFKNIKEKETKFSKLEKYEIEYVKIQKLMLRFKPTQLIAENSGHKSKDRLRKILNSTYTDYFIFSLLIIDLVICLMKTDESNESFEKVEEYFNLSLTIIFNLEIFLKIISFGRLFTHSRWNIFDLIIITLVDINIVLISSQIYVDSYFSGYLVLARLFKIILAFRMLIQSKKIKAIFNSFLYILPTISSIGLLLLVLITMFASIGTNIFGTVPRRKLITEYNNMENFFNSVLLLFRTALGGQWNSIMKELAFHNCTYNENQTDFYCVSYNYTCYDSVNYTMLMENKFSCGNDVSYAFFIIYFFLSAVVIMNLFIVLVVEGYSDNMFENESLFSHHSMEILVKVWLKYDPKLTFFVKPHEFVLIMKELELPLGFNYDRSLLDNGLTRYRNYNRFKLLNEVITLTKSKKLVNISDPNLSYVESNNSYDFDGFYITKDRKFYTNLLEVLKILKNFNFPLNSFDDSNDLDSFKGKIHFVNFCIGLAQYMVLKKKDNKISNSVNNCFTKKLWRRKYHLSKDFIFYGESLRMNKLIYKLLLDIFKKNQKQIRKFNENIKVFDITFRSQDLSERCHFNKEYLNKINIEMNVFKGKEDVKIRSENWDNKEKKKNFMFFGPKKTKLISFSFNKD